MLFDNSSKKWSLNKIKEKTGCTTIINGGLFNMSTLKPVTHLKVDGIVKVKDEYKYWGYGFNTNSKNFEMVNDYSLYDNYFCCVCLVKDSIKTILNYSNDIGGTRGRTAIGKMPNGDIVIYCSKDGTKEAITPEKLQDYFINLGVDSAIMLDSGGSSQCEVFTSSTARVISSNRIVSNLILIWEKDYGTFMEGEAEVETPSIKDDVFTQEIDMPNLNDENMWLPIYKEPTEILRQGSTGDGVKWLQQVLQNIGFLISVDGNYGSDTLNAVLKFQKYWSLNQGQDVGENTRRGLKEAIWGIFASDKAIINTATAEICRNETDGGDDKYILWYNNAVGTKFATTVAWCAIFVSWCMRRSNIDSKIYPNFASCSAGYSTFKKNEVVRSPKNYSPKAGDLIFYDFNKDNSPEHVGIVFANDGKYVYTIEGNSSDAVKHNKYAINNTSIFGYVEIN